jgi:hypothetical protein
LPVVRMDTGAAPVWTEPTDPSLADASHAATFTARRTMAAAPDAPAKVVEPCSNW